MLWKDVIIFKEKHAHNLCVRKTCVLKKNQPLRMRVPNRRSPSLNLYKERLKVDRNKLDRTVKTCCVHFHVHVWRHFRTFMYLSYLKTKPLKALLHFHYGTIFRNCESLYLHFISILSLDIFACASRNLLIRWPTWAV